VIRIARNAALLATLALPTAALADGEAPAASSSGVTNIHASKKLGFGLGGGAYNYGLTGKVFLGDSMAAQAFLGWGWGGINIGADALYQGKQLWTNGDFGLNWEAGAGAFISPGWGAAFGVNAVVGLSLQYRPVPVEITADIRPTFLLGNWGGWGNWGGSPLWFSGGGAIRYYF